MYIYIHIQNGMYNQHYDIWVCLGMGDSHIKFSGESDEKNTGLSQYPFWDNGHRGQALRHWSWPLVKDLQWHTLTRFAAQLIPTGFEATHHAPHEDVDLDRFPGRLGGMIMNNENTYPFDGRVMCAIYMGYFPWQVRLPQGKPYFCWLKPVLLSRPMHIGRRVRLGSPTIHRPKAAWGHQEDGRSS